MDFDKGRLLGDEEDVFFEHEQVALDGFKVSLDSWVAVSALEATSADDLLLGEGAEDGGDDLVGGVFVVFLELVVFRDVFPERTVNDVKGKGSDE